MGSIAAQCREIRRRVEKLNSIHFVKTAFTVKETAAELGCTQRQVREWMKLRVLRAGRRQMIPERQVKALKRELRR